MRYLLQKISEYDGFSLILRGYFISEKLDGIRVLWDGGVSRGDKKANVPWANTLKDGRYVREQFATGLWTQYGHPIYAPDWFLDQMPNAVMEGELFSGRGNWQLLSSAVKGQTPVDSDWKNVQFVAFDMPDIRELFANGKIRYQAGTDKMLSGALNYFYSRGGDEKITFIAGKQPYSVRRRLRDDLWHTTIGTHEFETYKRAEALEFFTNIVNSGGEGVVMKSPDNVWKPIRAKDILKWKPHFDTEAEVIGYTDGKGKYAGKVGALICKGTPESHIPGIVFECSGMTDVEREPGVIPIGSIITFRYRELSDSGVPKEPRYMRVRTA